MLRARGFVLVCFGLLLASLDRRWPPSIGTDFFPTADVGIIKLHYRAPAGTRLEETEQRVLEVQKEIRKIIPPTEIQTINDLVGAPFSFNLALVPSDNVSSGDAEILIQLKSGPPAKPRLHPRHARASCRRCSRARCSISRPPTSSARC